MIYNYLLHVTCMCTTSLCITLIKTYESLSMKLDVTYMCTALLIVSTLFTLKRIQETIGVLCFFVKLAQLIVLKTK